MRVFILQHHAAELECEIRMTHQIAQWLMKYRNISISKNILKILVSVGLLLKLFNTIHPSLVNGTFPILSSEITKDYKISKFCNKTWVKNGINSYDR